jgi:PPOX class probable F420-dependent enzyme
MTSQSLEDVRTLLDGPAAAVLTTTRKDGTALTSPVWFRWTGLAFEVVIARGDVKQRHLERDPRCALVIFETVVPFRGIEVRGEAILKRCDVTGIRSSIAGRYLGRAAGERFAADRASKPGVLLQLVPDQPRVWDLAGMLPS